MRRKLVGLLLALALLAAASPASAHSVGYTFRESGANECGPTTKVATTIYAHAHHKHTGLDTVIFHLPDSGVYHRSYVFWEVYAMSWSLYNQSGKAYSYSGSYGYCSSF